MTQQFNKHNDWDSGSVLIDLFDKQFEESMRRNGKVYARKIEPLVAVELVSKDQVVETRLPDGTLETVRRAKPGDRIVTGKTGEHMVFTDEKFDEHYRSDGGGGYFPRERHIIAMPNPSRAYISIAAPWGTPDLPVFQFGGEECFLVVALNENSEFTNDRYLIGNKDLLLSNYEPL